MKTLAEMKQWLAQHKPLLSRRYGVQESGIFSSYVRQEQPGASAIDMLVDFSEVPS